MTTGKFLRQHNQTKERYKKRWAILILIRLVLPFQNHKSSFCNSRFESQEFSVRIVDCTDCWSAKYQNAPSFDIDIVIFFSILSSLRFVAGIFFHRFEFFRGFLSIRLFAFVATKNKFFWLMTRFDVIMSFKTKIVVSSETSWKKWVLKRNV